MKKGLLALAAAVFQVIAFSSCGNDIFVDISEVSKEYVDKNGWNSTDDSKASDENKEKDKSESEISAETTVQECRKTIANENRPEVIMISFSGECSDNIKKHATASDLYGVHVLHSGVVGLVGVPIEIKYDSEVRKPAISFTYDTSELRGIPEKNLVMLHYNENDGFYDTVEDFSLNTDECTVSADIREQGVYLLADAYQWYSCWGVDVSEYEYEVNQADYPTDWERAGNTGSIMELADKEWAMENAPEFHVSTAEELASVVWYVNGIGLENSIEISIENDIDLTDYEWRSMGRAFVNKSPFYGRIYGNGHTINGMTIQNDDGGDIGFIGYGMNIDVEDISFTNAYVSGGSCIGIVGGELYGGGVWKNVYTQGEVIGGREDYGTIVGRETDITFENCSSDATVNGEKFEYLSYRQKRIDEVEIVETFKLTLNDDYTITRDDHEGFHNPCWVIIRDGERILGRGADDELLLDTHYWVGDVPGDYTIYLEAYINGTYIRVSNIVEYTLN